MHDPAITVDDILRPSEPFDPVLYEALKQSQTVLLGGALSIRFESRATSLGFLQSLVALEGLSCPVSLAAEIEVAEPLWRGPPGFVAMQMTLVPQAAQSPSALAAALAPCVLSLCLWAGDIAYSITLDGPLAPHMHAHVRLPAAALEALSEPGAQRDIGWQRPEPMRAAVPQAIIAAWVASGGD